jgi:hypothetical protein
LHGKDRVHFYIDGSSFKEEQSIRQRSAEIASVELQGLNLGKGDELSAIHGIYEK